MQKSTELRPGRHAPEAEPLAQDSSETSRDGPGVWGARGLESGKRLLFRLRWVVMSPEQRYAYLWARTKRSSGYIRTARLSRN